MSATYYTISDERVAEIVAADPTLTSAEVLDTATADWNEGDEHQAWLDTAPAAEIAEWVVAIIEQGHA